MKIQDTQQVHELSPALSGSLPVLLDLMTNETGLLFEWWTSCCKRTTAPPTSCRRSTPTPRGSSWTPSLLQHIQQRSILCYRQHVVYMAVCFAIVVSQYVSNIHMTLVAIKNFKKGLSEYRHFQGSWSVPRRSADKSASYGSRWTVTSWGSCMTVASWPRMCRTSSK